MNVDAVNICRKAFYSNCLFSVQLHHVIHDFFEAPISHLMLSTEDIFFFVEADSFSSALRPDLVVEVC